jgi:hypothetical protein
LTAEETRKRSQRSRRVGALFETDLGGEGIGVHARKVLRAGWVK